MRPPRAPSLSYIPLTPRRTQYLPALLISVISIVAGCCTQRFYLGNRHNAVEDKVVVAGREREEAEVREAELRRA